MSDRHFKPRITYPGSKIQRNAKYISRQEELAFDNDPRNFDAVQLDKFQDKLEQKGKSLVRKALQYLGPKRDAEPIDHFKKVGYGLLKGIYFAEMRRQVEDLESAILGALAILHDSQTAPTRAERATYDHLSGMYWQAFGQSPTLEIPQNESETEDDK